MLARHHGRKVWKRHEAPAKSERKDASRDAEQSRQALGDATNTSRPVKRLRLKDAPKVEDDGKENKAAPYFATLRDKENSGTPRRKCCRYLHLGMLGTDRWYSTGKQASKESLKPDNAGVKTRSASVNTQSIVDESKDAVQDDTLRARESLALEDVHELLNCGNDAANAGEAAATGSPELLDEVPEEDIVIETQDATPSGITTTDQATPTDEGSVNTEAVTLCEVVNVTDEATKTDNDVAITPASSLSSGANPFPSVPAALSIANGVVPLSALKKTPKALTEGRLVLEQPNLDLSIKRGANPSTPRRASPRKKSKLLSPHAMTTPGVTPKLLLSAGSLQPDYPGETPQIGTSLLRRESLRRKESPSKNRDARKSKTPKKRDTLQRRDTLQEREILQRVIAESTADHSDENLDALPVETGSLPSNRSAPGAEENTRDYAHASSEPFFCEEQPNLGTIATAEAVLPAVDETNIEKDMHRAMEAIEVYEHPGIADASQPLLDGTVGDSQEVEAMDKANEVLAKTEIDDVSHATDMKEQTPNQRTRSGARFSDDTSMLKDFLNRAQARKAAQKPLLSAPDAAISQHSPRRSPRKMLGSQDGQGSGPQKARNMANRANTPPSKPKTEAIDSDDGEEQTAETAEPASCRRSARTRLPAPSKAPASAPSFIPVRRADGTDAVVLQKSQAQEVAVTTRANTRRNKGQSKPPLLALQDLPPESADVASTGRPGTEKGKSVAWAERLASYRDAKGEADEVEERRAKVRRLRGLGAVNGIPAAKRTTAVVSSSNGTPAPKGRGKV